MKRKHSNFSKRLVSLSALIFLLLATPYISSIIFVEATPTATTSATSSSTTEYPWPMFRYNPAHTGYTPSPGPKTNRTLWKRGGLGYWVVSTPAVVDGVVYVGTDWGTKRLYALNAKYGTTIWHFTTGYSIHSSPTVDNGVVYLSADDQNLYALDATTGAKMWEATDINKYGGYFYSSPAVVGGVLYVGAYKYVYALNASTGAQIWKYNTGHLIFSSPAVGDDMVYIGSCGGNVYALNAKTGTKIWSYQTDDTVDSSPAVANGMVYVGSWDGYLYAFDAVSGTVIWNYKTGKIDSNSPAVADGIVYIGSSGGMVYALDAATGNKIWNYPAKGPIRSSPAVADGVVYIGSDDNNLYALNAITGTKIWSYYSGGDMYNPSVADGILFVGSYAYESKVAALYAIGGPPWPLGPTADFTFSPLKPLPHETVTFDASASEPGWDGTQEMPIVSYAWDFGDGYYGEGVFVNHVYAAEGSYTVTLNVTDSQGLWNTRSKMITVSYPPRHAPTAEFFYLPYFPSANKPLTFYVSDSTPGWNGTHNVPIANYTWDFGDGNITTTADSIITHIYAAVSTYTVGLTVTCQDDPMLIKENLTSSNTWRSITVQLEPKFTETTVYLNPATIVATEAGQSFTVEVRIADVIDLFVFCAGMTWDPSALECIDFKEGPFLTAGGVKGEDYLTVSGTISNVAGEIYPPYAITLTGIGLEKGMNGTGSGTLFIANFTAKKSGTFNVHPAELGLLDSKVVEIPANVLDVFTIVEEEKVYPIVIKSMMRTDNFNPPRIRIYNYGFNQTTKAISFSMTGEPGETGFCNVTVPSDFLEDIPPENWAVIIDGTEVPSIIVHNATHTFIYFTYTLSTHDVVIKALTSPTADFTFSPLIPIINQTVTFNASASTSSEEIISYSWNFGDGSNLAENDPVTTHNYTVAGTYTVSLDVTDSQGLRNTTSKNITVYASPFHDIAITDVTPSTVVVGQGYNVSINVTVENQGTFSETFNVITYYDDTTIKTKTVTNLPSGQETTITLTWNTTGVPYGNYTISAYAWPVPDEIDTTDNTYTDGWVIVTVVGDIDGDGVVFTKDLGLFARAWDSEVGDPNYNPRCDFDGDGKVFTVDLGIFTEHWTYGL